MAQWYQILEQQLVAYKAKPNADPSMIEQFEEEIARVRANNAARTARYRQTIGYNSEEVQARKRRQNDEYRRRNIDKVRAQVNASSKIRRDKLKDSWVVYKGGCCERCKQVVPNAAFDFHHTRDKKFALTVSGPALKKPWEEVKEELDKCLLLCATCHRIVHNERVTIEPDGSERRFLVKPKDEE